MLLIPTIRPIDVWPEGWRIPRERRPSPFRQRSYEATLDLLMREAEAATALDLTLQLDVDPGDLRRDGHLRAAAKVEHPGVIVTLDTKRYGVLTYPCDTFTRTVYSDPPAWQINLRAVALGLEALRKVARYGIAERGQQYAGFGALPPGRPTAMGPAMTVEEAARFLLEHGEGTGTFQLVLGDNHYRDLMFRAAAKRLHPDAGGNPALYVRLTAARDLLEGRSRR